MHTHFPPLVKMAFVLANKPNKGGVVTSCAVGLAPCVDDVSPTLCRINLTFIHVYFTPLAQDTVCRGEVGGGGGLHL